MASLFREQARIYAAVRPTYPSALYTFLASLTKTHERAWDVGTGNGQAAVGLADCYDEVIATDASEQQLRYAEKRPNITYACTSALLSSEEVTKVVGGRGCVDLVTAAQAVHWFHLDTFYSQVKHVLRKPGGVLAVWGYTLPRVSPEVDAVTGDFYRTTLPYWEPEIDLLNEGYESLHFPFEPVLEEGGTGPITMDAHRETRVEGLLGLFESWSAVNTARARGIELLGEEVQQALRRAWGSHDEVRTITFPLFMRLGCMP